MHKRKAMKTFTKLFIKSYEDSLKNELAENGLLPIALRQSQKVKKYEQDVCRASAIE